MKDQDGLVTLADKDLVYVKEALDELMQKRGHLHLGEITLLGRVNRAVEFNEWAKTIHNVRAADTDEEAQAIFAKCRV